MHWPGIEGGGDIIEGINKLIHGDDIIEGINKLIYGIFVFYNALIDELINILMMSL